MSVSRLPSGRYRAQVWDPTAGATGKGANVSVRSVLPDEPASFKTKREAQRARARAREALEHRATEPDVVTVADWQTTWRTDPEWRRPKESTNLHNHERVQAFCAAHADVPLKDVGDEHVRAWLKGGRRDGQIPALRAMFNDAASGRAGRLVAANPWANLGVSRGRGRRDEQPPSEEVVAELVQAARVLHPTGTFAAWLQVAAYTGMRPGELDALRWTSVDLDRGRLHVVEQYSSKSRTFTLPKNGRVRQAPLPSLARAALVGLPRQGEHCFPALQAPHWTSSSRAYHWKAVRAAVGYTGDLYLATRHFAGWYMVNVLQLASEDVAIALGHEDGGQLVRQLYGHRDRQDALDRVNDAMDNAGQLRSLDAARARRKVTAS